MTDETDEPHIKFQRAYKVTVQDHKRKDWYAIDFPLGISEWASEVTDRDALEIELMLHGALCRWRLDHPDGCSFNADGTPKNEAAQ